MEIAGNRGVTSLNPDAVVTNWGDGQHHPNNYSITNLGGFPTNSGCIPSPNRTFVTFCLRCCGYLKRLSRSVHAQNQSMAAGTSFAISYEVRPRFLFPYSLTMIIHIL